MTSNPESEWFGRTRVAPEEKTARVGAVFSSVAGQYDLMNDLMSGGLHRLWKDSFVARLRPRPGEVVVDVAGGTGDIAIRCARATKGRAVLTVCDINPAMIEVGRAKAIDAGFLDEIQWTVGNAEALPFADESADLVCIAFGLRNVTHIDDALAEFFRILKPGGRFYCMEFSPGVRPLLKPLYEAYSFSVLPWLGETIAGDRAAYQYLAESIRAFPDQGALAARMEKVGFENVRFDNLMGGIVAVHAGWRL